MNINMSLTHIIISTGDDCYIAYTTYCHIGSVLLYVSFKLSSQELQTFSLTDYIAN